MKAPKVETFMTKNIITLPKTAKVSSATRLMAERVISCMVIVDNKDKPIGIVTERDIVRRILFANMNPKTTTLDSVMSSPIITIKGTIDVFVAIKKMQQNKIRRLIITDSRGKLVGLITQTDLFKGVSSMGE